MRNRRSQGAAYEDLACSYLRRKGYKVLDRNVYLLKKEVDIVALDRDTVVFVEVKGRRSARFGEPSEAVGRKKQERLIRIAGAYLQMMNLRDRACRFDVISVTLDRNQDPRLEHIENAFEA